MLSKTKQPSKVNLPAKIQQLKAELAKYEAKLAIKMKGYRGVIHESAWSELRHSEVMVLKDMVASLKEEIHKMVELEGLTTIITPGSISHTSAITPTRCALLSQTNNSTRVWWMRCWSWIQSVAN